MFIVAARTGPIAKFAYLRGRMPLGGMHLRPTWGALHRAKPGFPAEIAAASGQSTQSRGAASPVNAISHSSTECRPAIAP